MQDLTKAQITIGVLAFFATVWRLVKYYLSNPSEYVFVTQVIILQFVVLMILSFVILAILQWLRIFELKINAILTLVTLVTIPMLTLAL
jgi:hypothetical protein